MRRDHNSRIEDWHRKGAHIMNRDRFYGICRQFGGTLMEQWGSFDDDERAEAAGTRYRFAGKLQERRGILKEQADRELQDFIHRNRSW